MFSHKKNDWATPDDLFERLYDEFDFYMDIAANASNTKLSKFTDDLFNFDFTTIPRGSSLWLNPPYGREAKQFIAKAYALAGIGFTVVCLLPARTDTVWFHDIVLYGKAEVRFLKGRLKFKDAPFPAPFPSMLAIFRPNQVNN